MAGKGFRKQAVPTKSELIEGQGQTIDQLKQHAQFLGQQLYQLMQQTHQMRQELTAMSNVVRCTDANRPAEAGDFLVIDFLGRLVNEDGTEGEVFNGGEGYGFLVQNLGGGNLIAGIEEQLVGLKAGESKKIDTTFPAEYHAKDLQNKKVTFVVQVLKVFEAPVSEPNRIATELHIAKQEAARKAQEEATKNQETAKKAEEPELKVVKTEE